MTDEHEEDERGEPSLEEEESPRAGSDRSASEELLDAIDHLKSAASILFERAAKDPAVEKATEEADRVIHKIAEGAEPLARQVTSEVARLTRRLSSTLSESLSDRPKRPKPKDEPDDL